MKKIQRAIIVALLIFNITVLNTSPVFARTAIKSYYLDLDSLNVKVKQYLTSLMIDEETKGVYANNTYVGNISSDPQSFTLNTTNYNINLSISLSNLSVSATVTPIVTKKYKATFTIEIAENKYYICTLNEAGQTIQSSRNGDVHTFGPFSYEGKTFEVKLIQSTGQVYVNGDSQGTLPMTNFPIVFEYIKNDFPITDIDYMHGDLPQFTWDTSTKGEVGASSTTNVFYKRNFNGISFKEDYTLSNEYLNLPSVIITYGDTVDEWARVAGTSVSGTGVWQPTGRKIAVVCEYNENYDISKDCVTAIRNEFPRYWAVYSTEANTTKPVESKFDIVKLKQTRYKNYYNNENWIETSNASDGGASGEGTTKQQRSQTKSWSSWTSWTPGYAPTVITSGENYKAEEKELYKYRTYAWEDATGWNASASICDYAGDGKYTTKTGEDELCGQEIKWYVFSNYGSPSASMYGETGGCNSYYGAKDVCGQHLKWYEFSNYGGASATMYGETGGCNSYYGANGVCGYNSCANAACGYNTCEAQSCGYATCTNASACGYKTCRADACGTESYVSSYSCAVYHSKTCSKSESYPCTKSTRGANCSACGSTKTCKRCYVGSSMETNCSYCGSTTTCNTCTYNYSATCTKNVDYDCSYTTYDGACYSTRNKSCATSACGANTCTSATCGYNKCEDSSCGAKTCTTSACGNKSCTWYTCPTDKTPVYENNECTWYTCPSEKEAVYGNKSCTLYKCQKKTYSAWSGANTSCPYLSGADVECVSDGTYYRYAERQLGDWGSWYTVSNFTYSNDTMNFQYRYSKATTKWEKEKAKGAVGSSYGWFSGEEDKNYEAFEDAEIAVLGTDKGYGDLSMATSSDVTNFQSLYSRDASGENFYRDLLKQQQADGYNYVLWDDFNQDLTSSSYYTRASNYIKKEAQIYSPYLYFYAWRFMTSNQDLPMGSGITKNWEVKGAGDQVSSTGVLIVDEEPIDRKTKVIYYDYRDPLTNYKDDLPENWEGYEHLIEEIKNSDLDSHKISVKLSLEDIRDMKEWLDNGGYDTIGTCDMLREFSYIFLDTDAELSSLLNSSKSCKIGDDD